tara:strand:+ start:209 stop:961 length:753 start_codon:yes stop_codon:yes gene_type:complete
MKQRSVNIMPMAGEGKRFKDAGYEIPKPLIDINGEPMFLRSAKCMPKADLWIFVVKEDLLASGLIEKKINENFKNNKIIPIKEKTDGQASTCFLAKKHLRENDQIFISSCDNYFEIDEKKFSFLSSRHDVLVFTTNANKTHLENTKLFGWVKKNNHGSFDIKCKEQVSSNPSQDRVIVGSFFFRNLSFFEKSIQAIFDKKRKINNEYYLDMAMVEAINLGFNVDEIIVKNYVSWGSYEELKNFKEKKYKV